MCHTWKRSSRPIWRTVYSIFRGSKYILSDRGGEFTSIQFTWLAEELGFIRIYTSSHPPTGNLMIEQKHSFLKASLCKLTCNNSIDWNELIQVAMMDYNVCPRSLLDEHPFYSMFRYNAFMPTLFKLLLPKLRYMSYAGCKIKLVAMRQKYMIAGLSLKTVRDKCPPPIQDPDKAEFKIGDMVLLQNHAPINTSNTKDKPSFRIWKWISDKAFDVQDNAGKVRCVSIQHLQLFHPTEHVLTHQPDITSFGWMM